MVRKLYYELPEERIALYPVSPRESCRLMVIKLPSLQIEDRVFSDIDQYLKQGDAIAVNDSRVMTARLKGQKDTGGNVEFLLLEKQHNGWRAMGRPAQRLREGMEINIYSRAGKKCTVSILEKHENGIFKIAASEDILEYGQVPLPPYIISRRDLIDGDSKDYQTNFASSDGSVASPTSALHFSDKVINNLKNKGVTFAPVTLHVGPGTFRSNYERPDAEKYIFSDESANVLNNAERICICGTTVMRTIETVYNGKDYEASSGETDLFIEPGHEFSRVKMFLTNFHLPGTPLLLMVAAFLERYFPGQGRQKVVELYEYALKQEYRFLSYGDAMLMIDESD
jgi:S-adenosylmethionine:tRNA ribosyltransferase-isomerase